MNLRTVYCDSNGYTEFTDKGMASGYNHIEVQELILLDSKKSV